MIQLTNLSATAINAEWQEQRGVVSAVHHEPAAGIFLHITLGPSGVVVRHDKEQAGIPLDEIVKLACKHNPKIGVAQPDPAPAAPPKAK